LSFSRCETFFSGSGAVGGICSGTGAIVCVSGAEAQRLCRATL
jgi:hypothetical protein